MHRRSLVLASLAAALRSAAAAENPLVISLEGSLPLLLTVPHDGDESIGSVPARTVGATVRDLGTRPLAEKVASLLEQKLKARPRLVIAKFSRKYLDVNRAEQDAMQSAEALPTYQAYHAEIARHVSELRAAFPQGALLLDIHGQSDDLNTTFRGSRAGLTAKVLVQRHGLEAIQGDKSILGGLASKGYNVNPNIGSASAEEDRRFSGGHTVYFYGSHRPQGIDAIQFEFGKNQRASWNLAEHFTEAIATFLNHYGYLVK
jgi:N-formylglutamate amidohydrolase